MLRTILLSLFLFFHLIVFGQENTKSSDNPHSIFLTSENFKAIQQSLIQIDSLVTQKHSVENTCGQALVGSLCAAGFAFLPFNAMSSKLGSNDQVNTTSVILTLAAYTLGAAVGVHWIAQSENPELSFWGTVGFSTIGTGLGSGLVAILASGNDSPPTPVVVLAALFPIISSIIYTSSIANWTTENQSTSLPKNSLSHKDLIQHSKIFNIELLRIKL